MRPVRMRAPTAAAPCIAAHLKSLTDFPPRQKAATTNRYAPSELFRLPSGRRNSHGDLHRQHPPSSPEIGNKVTCLDVAGSHGDAPKSDIPHVFLHCGSWHLPRCRNGIKLDGVNFVPANRRRLGLWMLWLSLFGLAPAAFACSVSRAATDHCCPTGQHSPCTSQSSTFTAQRDIGCCAAQPAAQQATITSNPSRRTHALAAPFGPGVGVRSDASIATIAFDPPKVPGSVFARIDQTQTYLLTGRLRL